MMFQAIRNLTIALIRSHSFGIQRLKRNQSVALQTFRVHPKCQPVKVARAVVVKPARETAPCVHVEKETVLERGWPYDTPLPSGLPRLPEGPDNRPIPTRPRIQPSPLPPPPDEVGRIVDKLV